jgi:two-component system sensor histidine kinase ChiS
LNIALREQRENTLRQASHLATNIQAETNSTFYLIVGLARLIEINGGITQKQFNEISQRLVSSRSGLRNIAAAPDMVIRYIYPLKGNETALGLDYSKIPLQREAAFRAKETGLPVIAGPIELVQGCEAIVGRFPVYVHSPETQELKFWGIISTPLIASTLYETVGLLDPNLDIEVSLRGRNALGSQGDIFFGSEKIEQQAPVTFPVKLLSGSWQIAAIPKGGWLTHSPNTIYIRIFCASITALATVILLLYYLYLTKVKRSRQTEREVAQIKERFYANMSHELRTPLNGIYGMSEVIQMSTKDPEIKNNAAIILNSAETLTKLLDDVLTLSRSDNSESIKRECIQLNQFIEELLPPLLYEAQKKQISLNLHPIPPQLAEIRTNAAMLRQILWNILSNAVKFTNSGSVSLQVTQASKDSVQFAISDTGIGIAPELLNDIFEDFVQEDDSNTREFGGAGLGLAVVKRLAQQFDVDVQAKSQKGIGSTFTVILKNTSCTGCSALN